MDLGIVNRRGIIGATVIEKVTQEHMQSKRIKAAKVES